MCVCGFNSHDAAYTYFVSPQTHTHIHTHHWSVHTHANTPPHTNWRSHTHTAEDRDRVLDSSTVLVYKDNMLVSAVISVLLLSLCLPPYTHLSSDL